MSTPFECPRCGQGTVDNYRVQGSTELIQRCDGCEAIWPCDVVVLSASNFITFEEFMTERGRPALWPEIASTFACPVCDHPGLTAPPYALWPPSEDLDPHPPYEDHLGPPSYEVCPRCGFEFGNDDNPGTAPPVSFHDYRLEWESQGRPWFDGTKNGPVAW